MDGDSININIHLPKLVFIFYMNMYTFHLIDRVVLVMGSTVNIIGWTPNRNVNVKYLVLFNFTY